MNTTDKIIKEFREKIRGHSLGALGYGVEDLEQWLIKALKQAEEEGYKRGIEQGEKYQKMSDDIANSKLY